MGRPYIKEMEELAQTQEWASRSSIADLTDSIRKIGDRPFFAVGSGGSLTAAAYWAMLHEWETGQPSKYGTPLDLMALPSTEPYAVGLMSAGGSNPDIMLALTRAASGGSSRQIILTYAQTSPLVHEAQCHDTADVVSYVSPIPKDGFLATNSLLASMIHIHRAYCEVSGVEPGKLSDLPLPRQVQANPDTTYSLLHAGWSSVAAVDFESRLVESGLAHVHLADLRNYAHGRYQWLERHGESTVVVALITPAWMSLFNRTLALLPPSTETIRLQTSHEGPLGAMELVVAEMRLIGQIAALQGLDPGQPHIPEFGRELYHLSYP